MLLEQKQPTITSTALPVMESFYTLQGEGAHTGRAAYFIRLGGCDVECFWCDVKESWDATIHPKLTVDTIVEGALQYPGRMAVITGGEPLMHDLTTLTAALQTTGFQTNIETSGSAGRLQGHGTGFAFRRRNSKSQIRPFMSRPTNLK